MGAFDDTICQLRDLGMSKVANIIRDLERDNMTLAGNNFKLREELTTLRQELESRRSTNAGWKAYYALKDQIDALEPVAWMFIDETGMKWTEVLKPNQAYDKPLFDLKGIKS